MPARRKIPLVWKGQKESEQRLFKYNHATQRVVQVGCDCPPTVTPPPPTQPFQYVRVAGSGDPGTGNFSIVPIVLPTVSLTLSITDTNSQDASTWLSTEIATSNNIKIEKDLSNYVILTRLSSTNNTTYWQFNCTIFFSSGIVNLGDTVTITYN